MHVDLVVPAYNEAGNLQKMVDETVSTLRAERDGWTFGILLVVSDSSTDGTQELAEELTDTHPEVSHIVRTKNFGFGNAIKDGLEYANGDVLIPFMADLSDDPSDIPKMIEKIREGYHVVYGSRFAKGGSVNGYPPLKLLYNRSFNNVVRLLFGIKERDVTNAFTAYRAEVINKIDMETIKSQSFDVTAELPLRATIEGFQTTEVPVSWQSREVGVSNLDATRKGPVYVQRVLEQFIRGNIEGLRDLFSAVSNQSRTRIAGAAVFGALLLAGLLSLSGISDVWGTLADANPVFIAGVAVVYPVSFLFRTWRWRVLLRAADNLANRGNVFRSICAGWLINSLIPARAGDAFRAYALKTTDGVPFSVGAGTVIIARVLDMIVLGSLMSVVALTLVRSTGTVYLALSAFGIAALLVGGIVVFYFLGERFDEFIESKVAGIAHSLRTMRQALTRVASNPFALALSLIVSIPVWIAEITTLFFAARAVGVQLTAMPTITAGISAFLSQTVPLTPGGLGTYEAAIASSLSLFGIDTAIGTAIGLIDHVTRLGVIFVLGTISAVHLVFASRSYFHDAKEPTNEGEVSDEINS
jgi:uncharacterized protein (TIRG00374 family)